MQELETQRIDGYVALGREGHIASGQGPQGTGHPAHVTLTGHPPAP